MSVSLPYLNQTGSNLWAEVQGNDVALRDYINAGLADGDIVAGAAIAGSKLAQGTVGATQLATDSVTPIKLATVASRTASTGPLSLTGVLQDVANCTYTTASAGDFLIWGAFDFQIATTDAGGGYGVGNCSVNGATKAGDATSGINQPNGVTANGKTFATVAQTWLATGVGSAQVIKLQAKLVTYFGTVSGICDPINTTLTVVQIG